MTIGEVFTHNIGDKYHYRLAPSAVPTTVDRMTIIDKYFSEFGDTVFYERFHDSYWTEVEWEPEPHLVYHFYSLSDTVFYTDLDSLISFYDNRFQDCPFWFGCDTIIIFTALGKLVDSGEWSQPYSTYDCQYLTPGLYFIQIEIDSKFSRHKLLIE